MSEFQTFTDVPTPTLDSIMLAWEKGAALREQMVAAERQVVAELRKIIAVSGQPVLIWSMRLKVGFSELESALQGSRPGPAFFDKVRDYFQGLRDARAVEPVEPVLPAHDPGGES